MKNCFETEVPDEVSYLDYILQMIEKKEPDTSLDSFFLLDNIIEGFPFKNQILKLDSTFHKAIDYLIEKDYLKGNYENATLTYKGLMRIHSFSFKQEYLATHRDKFYQRLFWFAAFLSLIISIIALFK